MVLRAYENETMKSKRQLSTIIINPKQQLRVVVYFLITFTAVTASLMWYFIASMKNTLLSLQTMYAIDSELIDFLGKYLYSFIGVLIFSMTVCCLIGIIIWLRLSHRIFGPLVPISRHIVELQNGNYSSRVQLRKDDFMVELKDELNLLAEKLEKK